MSPYYHLITETNKLILNKPRDSDMVYYSELQEWYTANAFRSFSVKCVLEKSIFFKIDNREHEVRANHFMLAIKQPDVKAYFDTDESVKSICIDICPPTVGEVFTCLTDKEPNLDNYLACHFRYPEFLETISDIRDSLAGIKLQSLIGSIKTDKFRVNISKEWFSDLMEKIVHQEFKHYVRMKNIKSIKPSTRKEIYNRLLKGKEFIDDNFLNIYCTRQVAQACFLSEYHFSRSFKQVFETSPYQYILRKKLEFSKQLMKNENANLAEIAVSSGFPDHITFSKAFKRQYHVSPSLFRTELSA